MFIGVQYHCALVSSFFVQASSKLAFIKENDEELTYLHLAEWLNMAAGIRDIGFSFKHYLDEIKVDSLSQDIDMERFVPATLKSIFIFNLLWGSLEAFISIIIDKKSIKNQGKINAAAKYIETISSGDELVTKYEYLSSKLVRLVDRTSYGSGIYKDWHSLNRYGPNGLGLLTMYKIRNKIAHGAAEVPGHPELSWINPMDRVLLLSCSRLILLSLQTLARCYYKGNDCKIECGAIKGGFTDAVGLHRFLKYIHLQKKTLMQDQESLNGIDSYYESLPLKS